MARKLEKKKITTTKKRKVTPTREELMEIVLFQTPREKMNAPPHGATPATMQTTPKTARRQQRNGDDRTATTVAVMMALQQH